MLKQAPNETCWAGVPIRWPRLCRRRRLDAGLRLAAAAAPAWSLRSRRLEADRFAFHTCRTI